MNNEITYHVDGDYLIPDLFIVNHINENYQIAKYGRLRLKYLIEHKRSFYVELLFKGKLLEHLTLIDKDVNKILENHIKKLTKVEEIDEKLKETNEMEWVQAINNIKNRAKEIVLKEVIYWQEVCYE